jgi:quinol monooxygenase YgiN
MQESLALLATMQAKPGKEEEVAAFLHNALAMAREETGTIRWYALRFDGGKFGIFDTFGGEDGRQAHLDGPIAQALTERADELLSSPPEILPAELLAVK